MYIKEANTRFSAMNMKSLLLFTGAMLLAAIPQVCAKDTWAPMASDVAFTLDLDKATSPSLVPVAADLPGAGDLFKEVKQSGVREKAELWYVLNIPVRVYALGLGRDAQGMRHNNAPAHYVRELKVTVYLLFNKPDPEEGSAKHYLVKKEITYVDIPMNDLSVSVDGREMGTATFNVAVFIPRSTASILTNTFKTPKLPIKKALVGYAVTATFKGQPCRDYTAPGNSKLGPGETRNSKIFEKSIQSKVSSSKWWKPDSPSRKSFEEPDVDIYSIAETPFAAFYSKYYPRVKLMSDSGVDGSSSSPSEPSADTPSGGDDSPAPKRTSKSGKRGTTPASSGSEDYDSSL